MMKLESHGTHTQVTLVRTPKKLYKNLAALILKKKVFCKGIGEKIKQLNRKCVKKGVFFKKLSFLDF